MKILVLFQKCKGKKGVLFTGGKEIPFLENFATPCDDLVTHNKRNLQKLLSCSTINFGCWMYKVLFNGSKMNNFKEHLRRSSRGG